MNGRRAIVADKVTVLDEDKENPTARSIPSDLQDLFNALDLNGSGTVSSVFFTSFLKQNGLLPDDPRLTGLFKYLHSVHGIKKDHPLTVREFVDAISSCQFLVNKCVTGKLKVPDFARFSKTFAEVFDVVEPNTSGANADYIPQLAEVDPDQFAISVTTVDGQHFSIGDSQKPFCIQSCSKPISYLIALKEFGAKYVHNSVGTEPSGRKFNEMTLKPAPTKDQPNRAVPHNPMINAGAIMAVSMVYPKLKTREERLEKVLEIWKSLCGNSEGTEVGYDDATYKSESGTADRNWCLGYMMKERKSYPKCFTSLKEVLELYFQICSITATSKGMSVMAATLANGGLNPLTGERVFSAEHVRNALPLMLTCGMYDYSGQWAFDVGVPAKSGVGGCVFSVIPNVCGIAVWSPRLDACGNSVRAVQVSKELGKRFVFNNFEVLSGLSVKKLDPTQQKNEAKQTALAAVLFAASHGDVKALMSQRHAGIDLYEGDYDSRTALHLAAAERHPSAVRFLIEHAPNAEALSPRDRWGGTPLDDAQSSKECTKLLLDAGAKKGALQVTAPAADVPPAPGPSKQVSPSPDAPNILFPASEGDVNELIKLRARGEDLFVYDYDLRTAMHLAASEGHLPVLKYLAALAKRQGKLIDVVCATDRWENTPLDDARREKHTLCEGFLRSLS